MNKLKKLYTIVAIISGIVICVIFLYSIKSNALHYKVNCFNDTTKVNAMSVYYNNNYYYVDKNKKIYKLSSDNENKCLISENYISGISVLGNYIYYISTEKLFRYNIETEFVELLDNECGYMYISSDNKYIYALRYINANYTNYRLLKINDNEKYEFATEDSYVDKDITIFQDSNYTYLYNNIPYKSFCGISDKNNRIIFRSNNQEHKNLIYVNDNIFIISDETIRIYYHTIKMGLLGIQ